MADPALIARLQQRRRRWLAIGTPHAMAHARLCTLAIREAHAAARKQKPA